MSYFRRSMTGFYASLVGMNRTDAAHFLRLAAMLEAFEAHLEVRS